MNTAQKEKIDDLSIKSNQLISLLMVLGSCAKDIEIEEMSSTIFLARNLAKDIDCFIDQVREGQYESKN